MALAALRGVRAAFVFLTRIPLGGFPYSADEWRWASAHFPFVGAALGAVACGVFRLLEPAGAWVAATTSIAVSLLLTGAFHEDGLADTADALGGGSDRARVLAILKDSRIGAFGAVALVIALLMKTALWVRLGPSAPVAILVGQTASRVGPVWLMVTLPYVTDPESAKSAALTRTGVAQAIIATLWLGALLTALAALGWMHRLELRPCAFGLLAAALATALCGWRFQRRVGGITGDFLGAAQQISELAMLLAWARA